MMMVGRLIRMRKRMLGPVLVLRLPNKKGVRWVGRGRGGRDIRDQGAQSG